MATKRDWFIGLRTCKLDGTSMNDFKYPKVGLVKCNDFSQVPLCGNGLHFLKDCKGNFGLTKIDKLPMNLLQILKVCRTSKAGEPNIVCIDHGAKYKCGEAEVLGTFSTIQGAADLLQKLYWDEDYSSPYKDYLQKCLSTIRTIKSKHKPTREVIVKDTKCLLNNSDVIDGGSPYWIHSPGWDTVSFYRLNVDCVITVINDRTKKSRAIKIPDNMPVGKKIGIIYNKGKYKFKDYS